MAGGIGVSAAVNQEYDRIQMLKAFDETKAGVKGLIDSGRLEKLPMIFVRQAEDLAHDQELTCNKKRQQVEISVIDLTGIHQNVDRRKEIVEQVRNASETWGFFQVVNHGIPLAVLDGMIEGVREFNEMDVEEKKKYYSRDLKRGVRYTSSHDLFTARTASWKDTLTFSFSDQHDLDFGEFPSSCRDSAVEYSKHVKNLGNILLGLLSEGLGLKTDHLKNMECSKGHRLHCHYYPACPQPKLAIGITKHSDAGFLTILLQNEISGLQVLYEDQWVDIQPVPGAFVINIGDLLQLVSNGKYRSNDHRAIATSIGPRISVACFFSGPLMDGAKAYGPIEELISEENPPKYKKVLLRDYMLKFISTGLDKFRALDCFKL